MKKIILSSFFSIVILIGMKNGYTQTYSPIAKENARWIIRFSSSFPDFDDHIYEYYLTGDTIINETDYKKVYYRDLIFSYDTPPYEPDGPYELTGFIRDDTLTKQVYAIKFYQDLFSECPEGEEYLMFDFSYQIGDTAMFCTYSPINGWDTITSIEQSDYLGVNTKQFVIDEFYNYYEGIGSDFGLFETMFYAVKKQSLGAGYSLDYYCPDGNCDLVVGVKESLLFIDKLSIKPNPFTSVTAIAYFLFDRTEVTLTIFNQHGKQVDLIRQHQQSGEQQITWNAAGLPSGIYFYTFEAGDQVATGKLVKM